MVSRAQFLIAVTVLAVAVGAAFLLLPGEPAPEPPREVVMTGAQFAGEYNQYLMDPPGTGSKAGSYEFPTLAPGDLLVVRDRITNISYNNGTRATVITLSGFGDAPALRDGLFFAGNLTGKYKAGDLVEMRFHVVRWTMNSGGTTLAGERLDELNGKAREKSPDGIPASAIRKYS